MPRLRPRAVLTRKDLPHQRATIESPTGGLRSAVPPQIATAPTATDPGESNHLGRLVAYIPAEIIAVYQALESFLGRDKGETGRTFADSLPVIPPRSENALLGRALPPSAHPDLVIRQHG